MLELVVRLPESDAGDDVLDTCAQILVSGWSNGKQWLQLDATHDNEEVEIPSGVDASARLLRSAESSKVLGLGLPECKQLRDELGHGGGDQPEVLLDKRDDASA